MPATLRSAFLAPARVPQTAKILHAYGNAAVSLVKERCRFVTANWGQQNYLGYIDRGKATDNIMSLLRA